MSGRPPVEQSGAPAPTTREQPLLDLIREIVREELRAVLRDEFAALAGIQNIKMKEMTGMKEALPAHGLWDVAAACAFLGVSSSWVYHRAAAGTIPCIRVGHNLRFDPEALRAWVRGERRGGRVVPLK